MNALSLKAVQRCETAQEPVCRCRCGGVLHGANRNGSADADLTFFMGLPDDDPHHMLSKDEKRERTNARKREETRLKNKRITDYLMKQ